MKIKDIIASLNGIELGSVKTLRYHGAQYIELIFHPQKLPPEAYKFGNVLRITGRDENEKTVYKEWLGVEFEMIMGSPGEGEYFTCVNETPWKYEDEPTTPGP